MERDQEHEADQKGMLMMARAGYHPDFVFALHHLLAMDTGEQSKFAAFFSDHPRWQTRDQRSDRIYSDALTEFDRLWPDAANFPGGNPPVVVFLGKPESDENSEARTARLTVPMYCRNSNALLHISVRLYKDKQPVKTTDGSFADKDGNFVAQQQSECLDKDDARPFSMELASSSVPDHDRSVKAEVYVTSGDQLVARSQMFDVHFPKQKK